MSFSLTARTPGMLRAAAVICRTNVSPPAFIAELIDPAVVSSRQTLPPIYTSKKASASAFSTLSSETPPLQNRTPASPLTSSRDSMFSSRSMNKASFMFATNLGRPSPHGVSSSEGSYTAENPPSCLHMAQLYSNHLATFNSANRCKNSINLSTSISFTKSLFTSAARCERA